MTYAISNRDHEHHARNPEGRAHDLAQPGPQYLPRSALMAAGFVPVRHVLRDACALLDHRDVDVVCGHMLNMLNRLFLFFDFTPERIFFIIKFKRGVNLIPVLLVDDFRITKYPGFNFLPTEIK